MARVAVAVAVVALCACLQAPTPTRALSVVGMYHTTSVGFNETEWPMEAQWHSALQRAAALSDAVTSYNAVFAFTTGQVETAITTHNADVVFCVSHVALPCSTVAPAFANTTLFVSVGLNTSSIFKPANSVAMLVDPTPACAVGGYVAGKWTQTKSVMYIAPFPTAPYHGCRLGFFVGLRRACPTCHVPTAEVNAVAPLGVDYPAEDNLMGDTPLPDIVATAGTESTFPVASRIASRPGAPLTPTAFWSMTPWPGTFGGNGVPLLGGFNYSGIDTYLATFLDAHNATRELNLPLSRRYVNLGLEQGLLPMSPSPTVGDATLTRYNADAAEAVAMLRNGSLPTQPSASQPVLPSHGVADGQPWFYSSPDLVPNRGNGVFRALEHPFGVIPAPRAGARAAIGMLVGGEAVYLFGGSGRDGSGLVDANQSLCVYRAGSNEWEVRNAALLVRGSPAPPLRHAAAVQLRSPRGDKLLFLHGGIDHVGGRASRDTYLLQISRSGGAEGTEVWIPLVPLPGMPTLSLRRSATAVARSNRNIETISVWVFGGTAFNLATPDLLEFHSFAANGTASYSYNVTHHTAPISRTRHAAVHYNDRMYIVGGLNERGELQAALFAFHTADRTWHELPAMPFGLQRHAAAVVDGSLFGIASDVILVTGGYTTFSEDQLNPHVLAYVIANSTWRVFDAQRSAATGCPPTAEHQLVASSFAVYELMGVGENGTVNTVCQLQLQGTGLPAGTDYTGGSGSGSGTQAGGSTDGADDSDSDSLPLIIGIVAGCLALAAVGAAVLLLARRKKRSAVAPAAAADKGAAAGAGKVAPA